MSVFSQSGLHHNLNESLMNAPAPNLGNRSSGSSSKLAEYQFECAWRLQQWERLDLASGGTDEEEDSDGCRPLFAREHYSALKSLVVSEKASFGSCVRNAK